VEAVLAQEAGPKEILEWNKRKALSCILAMEEHLTELKAEEIPHSWCILKHHLLLLDHHLYEAIGHAERIGEDSTPYRRFREKVLDLKGYPEPRLSLNDLVELRTEWRQIIKDPTLGVKCPLCEGDVAKILERASFHGSDEERGEAMITRLSSCLGVPKPPLKIIDPQDDHANQIACTISGGGFYNHGGGIVLCRGKVTPKAVAHEFYHYLSHLDKPLWHVEDPLEEEKAKRFAQEAVEAELCPSHDRKGLNTIDNNHYVSGREMVASGEVIAGLGGAILGVAADMGAGYAETTMAIPNLRLGADVAMAVGGVGGLIASSKIRASRYSSVLLGMGLAGVVKTVEALAAMVPGGAALGVPVGVTAVGGVPTIPVVVPKVAMPPTQQTFPAPWIAMELGSAEVTMPTYAVRADSGYRVGR